MTELLNLEIYKFMLIFLRIGSALMVAPGFSGSYINIRYRLSVALVVSIVVLPFLTEYLPTAPISETMEFIKVAFFEITYGIFLGLIMLFLYSALSLAGNFAGQSVGFANAQVFDPTSQNQSIILETFLSILAI